MKKTDIALIIIIVSISAGLSWWIASVTVGKSNDEPIIVRTVETIDVGDQIVDKKVFNDNAINPTVEAIISGTEANSGQTSKE